MNLDLSGQVALVTGSSRGIGEALAVGMSQAGAFVVCAARSVEALQETVRDIRQHGGKGLAVPTDVTQLSEVEALFRAAVHAAGGIDIVIANAGANFDRRPVAESVPADWQRTIDLNLNAAYYCARTAIPYLKRSGRGKIIFIGSGLGQRGMPGGAAYAVSKAGLHRLTQVLAAELWEDKICVNELIPGPVETALTPKTRTTFMQRVPMEHLKQPEEVVPLAVWLAAQPPSGPTGQTFSLMRR